MKETIFAPATAPGKAGVSVLRISGRSALNAIKIMVGIENPVPRQALYKKIRTVDGADLDEGIVIYFPCPNSFTGEDVVEFQTHGGRAVLNKLLEELAKIDDFRFAERGEFTRRAVENGKMDLTAAEGMADLINAETEQQRRQALRQMDGALAKKYETWRQDLVHLLAWIEAYIDFPEEEVPDSVADQIKTKIISLKKEINQHLADGKRGERLREGFQIVIIGEPNVGKSSLMNRLSAKDVAIVSSTAGTTRDIIEVRMDIKGYPVVICDTAGLRETDEEIEAEGVRRAKMRAEDADLILAVYDATQNNIDSETNLFHGRNVLKIMNKKDKVSADYKDYLFVSAKTGEGIDEVLDQIGKFVEDALALKEEPSLTRLRHRESLVECVEFLEHSLVAPELELAAEDLRLSMRCLGKITGQVQVEELLDVIFKDFCIGK